MARVGLLGLEPFLVSQIERLDRNLEVILLDAVDDDAREELGLSVVIVNSDHAGAPRLIAADPNPPVVVVEDGLVAHLDEPTGPDGPIRLSRPISSPDLLDALDRSRGLTRFRRSLRSITIQQDDAAIADRGAAVVRTVISLAALGFWALPENLPDVGIPALLILTLFAIGRSLWWRLSPLLVGIDALVVFALALLVGTPVTLTDPGVLVTILAAAVALEAGFVVGFWRALIGSAVAVLLLGVSWVVLLGRTPAELLSSSTSALLLLTTVATGAMARRLWMDQTQSRSSELRRFRSALYDLSRRQAVVAVSFDIGTVAEDALARLIADVHPRSAMVLVADGPGPLQVAASHNLASPPPVRLMWQAGMNEAQRALGSGPAIRHADSVPDTGETPDWSSIPDKGVERGLPDWEPSRAPRSDTDDGEGGASSAADARPTAPGDRRTAPAAPEAEPSPTAAPEPEPVPEASAVGAPPAAPRVPPSPSPVVAAMRQRMVEAATPMPGATTPDEPIAAADAGADRLAGTNHDGTNHDGTNHDATNHDATNHDGTNHDATNHDATKDHESPRAGTDDPGPDAVAPAPSPVERWGAPQEQAQEQPEEQADEQPGGDGTFDEPVAAPPPATEARQTPEEPTGDGLTAKLLQRMEDARREEAATDVDEHIGSRFDGQATAAPQPDEQAPLTSADIQQRLQGRRTAGPEEQRLLRDLLDRTVIESTYTARLSSVLGQLAPSLPPGDVLVTGAELDGELMGALVVVGATDIRAVARHAEETALALDSVRLFNRLRAFTRDQERARIGRSLHDGVMQTLAHVAFELDRVSNDSWDESQVETLGRMRDHVLGTVDEMRAVVNDLRTVRLDRGLPAALEAMALTLSPAGGPVIEVSTGSVGSLPGDVEEQFLRVAEEALMNAVRHSGARNVKVDLARSSGSLVLQVSDDGFGFTQSKVGDRDGGVGLTSMYQRAKSIGAGLDIDTGANGTIITVHQSLLPAEGSMASGEPAPEPAAERSRGRRLGRRG